MLIKITSAFLNLILQLSLTCFSHADVQAGVWDQLQQSGGSRTQAQIVGLEVLGNSVNVTVQKVEGKSSARETLKLCTEIASAADNDFFRSEEQRAAFFNQRMTSLREAYQSGELVQLSSKGPWSPCIQNVALLRTQKRKSGTNH